MFYDIHGYTRPVGLNATTPVGCEVTWIMEGFFFGFFSGVSA